MAIKIILLVVFFAVMLVVGILCRKSANSVNGFVLGGRKVGPWLTAFAYGTSYFSAVIFIGYAGQFGWKFGVSATWIGIGNAIIGSLLAWFLLGRRTRLMTRHLGASTMPEFFEKRFDSKMLKIVASLIVFIFLIPYTASLYNGLSRLFEIAFDLPYWVWIAIMAVLTCVYVIAGGYMATAVNDFIQGLIMLVGIVVVIVAVIMSNGGFAEAFGSLAGVSDPTSGPLASVDGIFASIFGPDPLGLLFVVILTSLGTWGLPQMVQKFYSIKSEGDIRKGMIISTVFAIVVAGGCYFLGGFGRLYPEAVAGGFDNIIPTMLASLNNDFILALVLVLVLSASMSTLSSLVLTSSSTLVLDLVKGNIVKNMDNKKQLLWVRIFILVFVAISVVIALVQYYAPSGNEGTAFIAQLMGISWGALAGAFLAPFLLGLCWKKVTKPAVLVNFIFAVVVMTVNMFVGKQLAPINPFFKFVTSPVNLGAIVMMFGFVIVIVISLLTKKPDQSVIDNAFACYSKKVTVAAGSVLSEEEKTEENEDVAEKKE
ncbi:MAG: sodium/solute symporter [Clostridia bacterium]|nr:sodium/solute symporter [Clostridia bacterium]